jgi:diamine N-acetyltransferase
MVQLERIYVLPGFQGQQIGSKLLEFAEKQALNNGAEWIWLTVWEHNPDAQRFYERHGYELFGTEIFTIGNDDQTDLLMRKRMFF